MKSTGNISIIVIGLIVTLGGVSWGQVPPGNDLSDGNANTGGGGGTLGSLTTGGFNTAYGSAVLNGNTTGSQNTASGASALRSNTTGDFNTAYGSAALNANTTGSQNTATGVSALRFPTTGSQNTASGVSVLRSTTTGSQNTAGGVNALRNNTTGSQNTAGGVNALAGNTTGGNNIAVGTNAGLNLTTGSNNIAIGHSGVAGEAGTMRLGSSGVQTRTFIAGVNGVTVGGSAMVVINSSGQLGTVVSSARYKRDIKNMGSQSQGLHQLRPVTFLYTHERPGAKQYGLIAEEVAEVYPELVTRSTDGKVESVQYHELIPMLLNEVQRQRQGMEAQSHQLTAQAQEIAALKAKNAHIETALGQLQAEVARVVALQVEGQVPPGGLAARTDR